MTEREEAFAEMELKPEELRRVRASLVNYVEKALGGESPVNTEFFTSALHSLDRMMDRAVKR